MRIRNCPVYLGIRRPMRLRVPGMGAVGESPWDPVSLDRFREAGRLLCPQEPTRKKKNAKKLLSGRSSCPAGASRRSLTLTSRNTSEDIAFAVDAFARALEKA